MFDIGLGELVFIFVVFLILFGPKSLPDLARKIAYGMNKIKQAQAEFQSQFNSIQHEIQSTIEIDKKDAGIKIEAPKIDPSKISGFDRDSAQVDTADSSISQVKADAPKGSPTMSPDSRSDTFTTKQEDKPPKEDNPKE